MSKSSAKQVLCITGFPASGKSTATQHVRSEDIPVISMGDIVRELAVSEGGISVEDGEGIGNWATAYRAEHGNMVFARETVFRVENTETDLVVIDGSRTPKELEIFIEEFDSVTVVFIDAPQEERFKRVTKRGRDGQECNFSFEEFRHRDDRESSWGLGEIKEVADFVVDNTASANHLKWRIGGILRQSIRN